jgi:hypothetical protein
MSDGYLKNHLGKLGTKYESITTICTIVADCDGVDWFNFCGHGNALPCSVEADSCMACLLLYAALPRETWWNHGALHEPS